MKKTFILILLLLLTLFIFPGPVFAHFLATDGSIGGVVHLDPNDDPIAQSQTSFFFEFKDKENKFKPQNCICTFEIDENGINIFNQPLFQNNSNPSLSNASVIYTFPQKDVYNVKVVGKPLFPNAFQPFTLSWNFRVEQVASSQNQTSTVSHSNFILDHIIHFVLIAILLIGFLIYILTNKSNNIQKRKGGEKRHDKKNSRNMY